MSSANQFRYQMAEETGGYGASPSGTYTEIRKVSSQLRSNPQFESSDEINTSGNVTDSILTEDTGGGPIEHQFSAESYDEQIQAILRGTWTNNGATVDSVGWDDAVDELTGNFGSVGQDVYLSVFGFPSPYKPSVYRSTGPGDVDKISVEEFGELEGGGNVAGAPGQKAEPGDTCVNGTTDRSFTIEGEPLDLTTNPLIRRFTGHVFTNWTFNAPVRGPITTSFGTLGNPAQKFQTRAGSGVTAANANTIMDGKQSKRQFGLILPDGTAFSTCLVEYSHQLNVPVTLEECQGSSLAVGFSTGRAEVTGAFQLYLRDDPDYLKLIEAFDTKQLVTYLYFSYLDGDNKGYTFSFKNVRLTGLEEGLTGPDTDVFLPFTFQSILQAGGGGSMAVTRYLGT